MLICYPLLFSYRLFCSIKIQFVVVEQNVEFDYKVKVYTINPTSHPQNGKGKKRARKFHDLHAYHEVPNVPILMLFAYFSKFGF